MRQHPDPHDQPPAAPSAGDVDAASPQLPNGELAARMAANMLQSALAQKDAIADSFKAQRGAILDAVATQKNASLASLPSPSATAGVTSEIAKTTPPQGPAATVEHSASVADSGASFRSSSSTEADAVVASTLLTVPPDLPAASDGSAIDPEVRALRTLLAGGLGGIEHVLVANAIVETLRALIAREVSYQLSAARREQG